MERTELPVAVFDSGLGGISVLRALVRRMPGEDFLYFGDSANAPYGVRPAAEVRELTQSVIARLYARGIKAAVIACNTATSAAIGTLRAALGLRRLTVVNDFTALALALPALGDDDLVRVGGGEARAAAARALIGAGTGLGVSGLLPVPGGWVPLQGEGGHVSLPASTPREANLIALLAERYGHVSAERVLSGPGLVALHDALRRLDGLPARELDSATISARGLAGQCPVCTETLHLFCALLGTVAGDLALTLGARGGVFVGGGIVPRLGEFFARSAFRERFLAKGRFRSYLETIPTRVIRAPYAALTGAAHALDTPFAVGFDSRAPLCASTPPLA